MPKITICSPQLGITPGSNSGGEVYDREVLSNLSRSGVKVYIYLPRNRRYPNKANFTRIDYAPISHIYPPYLFNLLSFHYLEWLYVRHSFDILRVHSPYFVGPAAAVFKLRHPSVPVTASYLHLEENSLLQPLVDKALIKFYDRIITISKYTQKEIIRKYGVNERRIVVAYPGISQKYEPAGKNQHLINKYKLEGKTVLLFIGGLKKRKNPEFLIDAIKKVHNDKVILLIAGSGPLEKNMKSKVKNYNLGKRVIFTGYILEDQKVNYYNIADIVLFPSTKEGFGMIAAEAGACGKAVIASNNSSIPEVIKDGKTGLLAKTNDINAWVGRINELISNKYFAKKLGLAAVINVRNRFSWKKNSSIHLQVFEKLLKK